MDHGENLYHGRDRRLQLRKYNEVKCEVLIIFMTTSVAEYGLFSIRAAVCPAYLRIFYYKVNKLRQKLFKKKTQQLNVKSSYELSW